MRLAILTKAVLLFGIAAAQIELPDSIDIPDNVEIPDSLPTEVPDWAQGIVSDIASGVAPQATPTDSASHSQSTPGSGTDSDTLPGLVDQLPRCAVSCLVSAADDIGCSSTDFACLCRSGTDLATSIGPCVLLSSGCGSSDARLAAEVAPQICNRINNNPPAGEVASASAIVAGAVATADGASPSATAANDSAAGRSGVSLSIVASLALIALVV
ncbi:hypothetical protein BN1723_014666 [Verticillium longisporum]|uniref:CFEM domain-containing protein n=1 Tax=Verticillium longisporum TaxID=100787 RepID=A0A0G4MEL1_VERLO|nr:hypothetical protein HYQ44_020004 [Verticillium longisporum]CRK04481.1 hypothetical protein BN1708_009674 [Verticillium longisporum]CRK32728.1 hypothetical protein BN1723_014666 [Verticillium longisporum]